jgi:hypothetical protein
MVRKNTTGLSFGGIVYGMIYGLLVLLWKNSTRRYDELYKKILAFVQQ